MIVILPAITILCITTIFSAGKFVILLLNHGFPEIAVFYRVLYILAFSMFVVAWGLKNKSINKSGALAGLFVSLVLGLSNYGFLACLMTFFYTSSKATKLCSHRKLKFEDDYKEGGQRNWIQALCNAGAAVEFALLYMLYEGVGECALNFNENLAGSWLCSAVISSLASANGDTWASEIGTVLANNEPRLVTSFQKVPTGTNGGVSVVGLSASALGGFIVGVAYFCTIYLAQDFKDVLIPQLIILSFVGAFAGLFGSIIDSFIGATLQYSGVNTKTGKIVESPGPGVKHICGRPILNNHSVNMISSIICSLSVPTITAWLYCNFL